MTTEEAFQLAIEKVEELKKHGIKVSIEDSKLKNDRGTRAKYNKPDRVKWDKWLHVTFLELSDIDIQKVHEAANYLGLVGIEFDTGGWDNNRDWELDWSFKYSGKENKEWRDKREEVEHLIKKLNKK